MTFLYRKRSELTALLFMCVVYYFSYFQRVGIPGTVFDELQSSFSASAVAIAALASIFLYIYGGMQSLGGFFADRYGGAQTLLAGGLFLSVGSISFALAPTLSVLYASRAIVAFGSSLIFISIVKEVDVMFAPRHFAILMGASVFIGYSGGLTATWPLDRAVARFGWRPSFLTAGVLSVVATIAALIILRNSRAIFKRRPASSRSGFMDIVRNPHSYPILLSYPSAFAIYFLFQATIGKKLLMDTCGISSSSASSVTFAMMLVSMIGASTSGMVSRLAGNRRTPLLMGAASLILAATGGIGASLLIHPNAKFIAVCMASVAIAAGMSTIFLSSMKELNPPESAATSVGLLNGTVYLLVALVSHASGYVMDSFKEETVHTESAIIYPARAYALILLGCFALAACSFASSLFIKESRGNSIYRPTGSS